MTHPPGVRSGERDLVDLFGRLHRDGASPHQHRGLLQLRRSRPEAAGGRRRRDDRPARLQRDADRFVVVVLIFVITRQDPVLALFTWLTQLGTLAIIVLMAFASFAVVAFFARHRDFDRNVARTAVAPIVGGVAMTAVAIHAASQFGLLIGNPDSPLRWILPALIVVAAIAGVIAAFTLKSRSPELYTQAGRHRDIELTPGF
jgi:hypothetical protein